MSETSKSQYSTYGLVFGNRSLLTIAIETKKSAEERAKRLFLRHVGRKIAIGVLGAKIVLGEV